MSIEVAPATATGRTWGGELDRFESELERVERGLADPAGWAEDEPDVAWEEPRALGPIPAELAGRARGLLRRQQLAAERLGRALDDIGRQQRYATHVNRGAHVQQAPAYLDVTA